MKVTKLSIIFATLTCLMFTSNIFAEEQQSFIRKVLGGGFVSQLLQMKNGTYVIRHGNKITEATDLSAKRISEVSLTFNDIPYNTFYVYAVLSGMAQTSDGFVLVGVLQDSYYALGKGMVVKVSLEGEVIWKKLISVNQSNQNLRLDSVISTADGGFIVTAWTLPYDIVPVLIKFSSSGDVLWSKSFEIVQEVDCCNSPIRSTPTLDGGIILAAELSVTLGKSIGANVVKVNGSGNLVWAVSLEMEEFFLEEITALSDKGYLLTGKTSDPNKLLLIRLKADGTLHSKAAYSLDVPDFTVYSLAQTPDRGIAIGGVLQNKSGPFFAGFLLKINDRQELILQKRLGFPGSRETITSVIAKEDGSYLLFGSTGSDTLFVGLNSDGLAPGCNFSHNMNASKVLFGKLKHKSLVITPNTFSVNSGGSLKVTSKRLNRKVSNVCIN